MIYEKSLSVLSLTLIVGVTSFITTNIWFWPSRAIYYSIFLDDLTWLSWVSKIKPGDLVFRILRDSIIITGWSGLYFALKFWKDWKLQKDMAEKANVLAQQAQLQMLRYQLNPHFLFNSLNSIRALIAEDKKNAKAMITELSEFLRYSLVSKSYSEVPLGNEIEAVRHYFAVEKVRYEEKLDVSFEIDPLAEDYPIISFIIHPLAENAIKYGMRTSSMPLKIRIRAKVLNGTLNIEVCNTGKWVEPEVNYTNNEIGTGTGLKNVYQRLENAYPNRYRLDIDKRDSSVHIKLTITNSLGESNEKTL